MNGMINDNNDSLLAGASKPFRIDRIRRLESGMWFQDNQPAWALHDMRPWFCDRAQVRHNGRQTVNAVFFDGHAQSVGAYTRERIYGTPFAYIFTAATANTFGKECLYYWYPWN